MDRRSARFIRVLEEMRDSISDRFSETADALEKEFSEDNFKKLSVGMKIRDGSELEGIIIKIDGIHSVSVRYEQGIKIHCMDDSCFHYNPIKPLE